MSPCFESTKNSGRDALLPRGTISCYYTIMNRETSIAKLTEIQKNAGHLLSQLQASEHDKFAAYLYRSRRQHRSVCQRAGKSGKQIERSVISTFQVAGMLLPMERRRPASRCM
jgi:hypothetical protein